MRILPLVCLVKEWDSAGDFFDNFFANDAHVALYETYESAGLHGCSQNFLCGP